MRPERRVRVEGALRPHDHLRLFGRLAAGLCRIALRFGGRRPGTRQRDIAVDFPLMFELPRNALGNRRRLTLGGPAAHRGGLRVFGPVLPGAQRAGITDRPVGEDDAAVGQPLLDDVAQRRGLSGQGFGRVGPWRLGRIGLRRLSLGSERGQQQGQSGVQTHHE